MERDIAPEGICIPDEIKQKWQTVVDIMAELAAVPAALIMRLQSDEMEVFRASESEGNPFTVGMRMQLQGLYCKAAIEKREGFRIPNALKDDFWRHSPGAQIGMIAYMGFPIFWPNGQPFGTICVLDWEENRFEGVFEQLLCQFRELIESHLGLLYVNHVLDQKAQALARSLAEIQTLRSILPICASCKKIRNDKGYWEALEVYLRDHVHVEFSHGYCPECLAAVRLELVRTRQPGQGRDSQKGQRGEGVEGHGEEVEEVVAETHGVVFQEAAAHRP